jgi:murein DD-endopeptidase MepM/ murein hydrolase activator NlpD
MLQFFRCGLLIPALAVGLNCSAAAAQNCEQIKQQMNAIAANAGWGDLARLKNLEQRYYACQRGGARAAQPPANVKTFESTEYDMKRKNNYCGTDGVYTFYCPKGRACLHKNASGCAPAKQITAPAPKVTAPPKASTAATQPQQPATASNRKPLQSWETRTVTQSIGKPWSANPAKIHTGIDISATSNESVFPVTGGRVVKVGWLGCIANGSTLDACPGRDQNWGSYVVVQRPDGTANGYLHLDPNRLP